MENKIRELDIMIIGKTGYGKSSLGNSILNKKLFDTSDAMNSCTKDPDFKIRYNSSIDAHFGVIDTPGLYDTIQTREAVLKTLCCAISQCCNGVNAIILVLKFGKKVTIEDKNVIIDFKNLLGEDFVMKHCIIAMTNGDRFDRQQKQNAESFDEWCQKQTGLFKDLLDECNNRIILFYNKNKPEFKSKQQAALRQLVDLVRDLSKQNGRYNGGLLKNLSEKREELLQKHNLYEYSVHIQREVCLLEEMIEKTLEGTSERNESFSRLMKDRADNLLLSVCMIDNFPEDTKNQIKKLRDKLILNPDLEGALGDISRLKKSQTEVKNHKPFLTDFFGWVETIVATISIGGHKLVKAVAGDKMKKSVGPNIDETDGDESEIFDL